MKGATTTGIALASFGLGLTALIVALTKPVAAAIYIPTVEDIESSESFGRLEAYYSLIGDLYLKGAIDKEKYDELYSSYEQRYYELLEA